MGVEGGVIAGKANGWRRRRKTRVVRAAERKDKILRKVKRLREEWCMMGALGGWKVGLMGQNISRVSEGPHGDLDPDQGTKESR